ncbi:MAG: hypothetical protein FWD80_06945, partial [Propionibacteriaceae bacterium]|nr:hypothetical protein [Propionibacteriaceae bacterium]
MALTVSGLMALAAGLVALLLGAVPHKPRPDDGAPAPTPAAPDGGAPAAEATPADAASSDTTWDASEFEDTNHLGEIGPLEDTAKRRPVP